MSFLNTLQSGKHINVRRMAATQLSVLVSLFSSSKELLLLFHLVPFQQLQKQLKIISIVPRLEEGVVLEGDTHF